MGEAVVDPDLGEVLQAGESVKINPKASGVLRELMARAGEVVPKDELLEAVWGDRFVSEDVLTNAVYELRKAFDDDARHPRVIQTVHRRGYRLLDEPLPIHDAPATETARRSAIAWTIGLLALVATVTVVLSRLHERRLPLPVVVTVDPQVADDDRLRDGIFRLVERTDRLEPVHASSRRHGAITLVDRGGGALRLVVAPSRGQRERAMEVAPGDHLLRRAMWASRLLLYELLEAEHLHTAQEVDRLREHETMSLELVDRLAPLQQIRNWADQAARHLNELWPDHSDDPFLLENMARHYDPDRNDEQASKAIHDALANQDRAGLSDRRVEELLLTKSEIDEDFTTAYQMLERLAGNDERDLDLRLRRAKAQWFHLADCGQAIGSYGPIDEEFEDARAERPDFLLDRAWAHQQCGQPNEARAHIDTYRSIVGTDPKKIFAGLLWQAILAYHTGAYAEAERVLGEAGCLEADGGRDKQVSCVLARVPILSIQGRCDEAFEVLRESSGVVAREKEDLLVLHAQTHWRCGDTQAALAKAEEAIREGRPEKPSAQALMIAGLASIAGGNPQAAQQHLARAEASDNETTHQYDEYLMALRGSVYIEQGKRTEGLGALAAIVDLDRPPQPRDRAHYLSLLGRALRAVGREQDAWTRFRQALTFNPSHPPTLCALGASFADGGHPAAARTCFEACGSVVVDGDDDAPLVEAARDGLGGRATSGVTESSRPATSQACLEALSRIHGEAS